MPDSVFSKIRKAEIPGELLYEDDKCFVILTIGPHNPGHMLVVPIDEIADWEQLPTEIFTRMMKVAQFFGLAEEAQMLATTKCNKYPLLSESVIIYNDLFNDWFKNREDESKILEISDKLRIHRKKLIAIYFFDDNYDINNFSKSSMG